MAKLGIVKQDQLAQQEGRWFPWMDDIRLRIRPIDNDDYQALLRELQEPHQQILQAAPDSETARLITRDVVRRATATHILVDWENVEDEDGSPLPFDIERVVALFNDSGYVHLYRFVLMTAQNERNFLVRQRKADSGN